MKRAQKRFAVMLLAMLCLLTVFGSAEAAAAANIQAIKGIKWDLRPNKKITYQTAYAAVGMKNNTVKMTKFSITDAPQSGYKKLTYTLHFSRGWKPTAKEVHKIVNSKQGQNGHCGGYLYYTIVDYETGTNLEEENPFDVTVTSEGWNKSTSERIYRDSDGCWVTLYNRKINVTVIYPEDYTGLCIGAGGSSKTVVTSAVNKYWEGKTTLFKAKALYSTKYKKIAHFMKVN